MPVGCPDGAWCEACRRGAAGAPLLPRAFCRSEGSPGHLQHLCAERQGYKTQACVSPRGALTLPGHVRSWFALLTPRQGWGKPALILLVHPGVTARGQAPGQGRRRSVLISGGKHRRCWTSWSMASGEKPTGSWRPSCNEAAAVPDALMVNRGPQPLAAVPGSCCQPHLGTGLSHHGSQGSQR